MISLSESEITFVRRIFVDDESVLEKSSDKIRAFLQEYPDILPGLEDNRYFSLHRLCRNLSAANGRDVRIRLIQQLIDIDASCLLKQDWNETVPLHNILIACRLSHEIMDDPACMELMQNMIRAQPTALSAGTRALDYACDVQGEYTLKLIRLLFEANPEAAMIRNDEGDLPLHEDATGLLQEEYSIQETMESMNAVAETLQTCDGHPCASIVLEWTMTHNVECLEKLAIIESELNDLIATYKQNLEAEWEQD